MVSKVPQKISRNELYTNHHPNQTPELQILLEKKRARDRKFSSAYYSKFKKKRMNKEPLEEREVKRIQASNRSKEWRNANPENKKSMKNT